MPFFRLADEPSPVLEGGLDALLDAQKSEAQRLDQAFDSARDAQQKQGERLDELFREAKEQSRDDEDRPRNPFDLD